MLSSDIVHIQKLINSGLAWHLEGHVGRTCMRAIENGDAMLGALPRPDAYGNVVPARHWLQDGTKGTIGFVAQHHDAAYAHELACIGDESPTMSEMLSACEEN